MWPVGVLAACYTHTAHPGQVTVTEYGDARFIEVAIADFRVPHGDGSGVWFEAEVVEEQGMCQPFRVRFTDDTDEPAVGPFAFDGRAGHASVAETDDGLEIDPTALATALLVEPVTLHHGSRQTNLHTEHVFNLRQLVSQLSCVER